MQSEKFRGYLPWGHAILQPEDILHAGRYAVSDTITRDTKVIDASGVPGVFDTEEMVEVAGLAWARAWVDNHG